MQQRSEDRADGQPGDAHGRRQQDRAGRDAQWVDYRRQRRQEEVLEAVEGASLHRADAEEHGREQHDAHHLHRLGLRGRREPGSNERADQPGREDPGDAGQHADDDHHQVGDGCGQPPGAGPVAVGQEIGEDGDERSRQGAAGHHCEQQVRQLEGRVIRVQRRADAKLLRNNDVAEQPGHRCQSKEERDQQRVACDVGQAGGEGRLSRIGHCEGVACCDPISRSSIRYWPSSCTKVTLAGWLVWERSSGPCCSQEGCGQPTVK